MSTRRQRPTSAPSRRTGTAASATSSRRTVASRRTATGATGSSARARPSTTTRRSPAATTATARGRVARTSATSTATRRTGTAARHTGASSSTAAGNNTGSASAEVVEHVEGVTRADVRVVSGRTEDSVDALDLVERTGGEGRDEDSLEGDFGGEGGDFDEELDEEDDDEYDVPIPPATPGVLVTLYRDGRSVVVDRRTRVLEQAPAPSGTDTVNGASPKVDFEDLPRDLNRESVSLRSHTDPNFTNYGCIAKSFAGSPSSSAGALLDRSIGSNVTVTAGKAQMTESGTLLAFSPASFTIQSDDGSIVKVPRDEAYPERLKLPADPVPKTKPCLTFPYYASVSGEHLLELVYSLTNVSYNCNFTIVINHNGKAIDLNGQVLIANNSGHSFTSARLALADSEVDINYQPRSKAKKGSYWGKMKTKAAWGSAMSKKKKKKRASNSSVCPLQFHFDIPAGNSNTSLQLVNLSNVPSVRTYVYDGAPSTYDKRTKKLESYFTSGDSSTEVKVNQSFLYEPSARALCSTLPEGRVSVFRRVYHEEGSESLQKLTGIDVQIGGTVEGDEVLMCLGTEPDLSVERKRVPNSFTCDRVKRFLKEKFTIVLKNTNERKPYTVLVKEHLHRCKNWRIKTSTAYDKLTPNDIQFEVVVPPGGENKVTISYEVLYTWGGK